MEASIQSPYLLFLGDVPDDRFGQDRRASVNGAASCAPGSCACPDARWTSDLPDLTPREGRQARRSAR